MKNSKRFLAFISSILLVVMLMPVSLAASSNDLISRDRNIANQVLSKVTALFTDVYTITDASASVKNKTADKSGNTVYTIDVSFKRTLKATSATEIPLVQGLLTAKSQLTGREEISAADAYITARMKDFNDNYIGVAQDTTGIFIITLPATSGSTLVVVPNSISINNITMENEVGNGTVPATSVAPRSASEQIQGGKALMADVVSATNNNARTNNSILTTTPNPTIQQYNRVTARNYARNWSCTLGITGDHETCHNSSVYLYFEGLSGTDCTNFVSQCLHEGGLPTDSTWYKYSTAWTNTRKCWQRYTSVCYE